MFELASITAAVLAGGLGTRLRSVVSDRPKVLADVGGRPFLSYLLDMLVTAGVSRVVICNGHLGEMVQQAFGANYGRLALDYSHEEAPLGTGGALRAALPRINSEMILALNGDSLCRTDLAAFAASHVQHRALISLVLAQVDDTSRYGRVELDSDGRVLQFVEKGQPSGPGWINAGVYLIQRRVVDSIAPDAPVSLERTIFPSWLGRGLYGHCGDREFLDIGTPESYSAAPHFVSQSL
jgi:D-glycero-alpha-D-manno-heptose 1-phosphate guanylyltransferase